MLDDETRPVGRNRFIRFSPNISTGHITLAAGIIFAWATMRSDVSHLLTENDTRKLEIANVNTSLHSDLEKMETRLSSRFDRIEDKLDRKADKK
jgi:hypothetical protein